MPSLENNFDALRFWAALVVLWSHSVPLTEGSEHNELLFRLTEGQTTTGTVAVFVFFAISGYLITRSFERAATPWQFVRARVLRIVPGLLAVVLASAFVLGPLASSLPWQDYFGSPEPYRYVRMQSSLFFGWCDALPGVFTSHPLTAVNGAIWTLRFEAECYGLVFLLGVSGLLNKRVTLALYALIMIGLTFFPSLPGRVHLELVAGFLAGAAIHQWQLAIDRRIALACLLATLACLFAGQIAFAQRALIPYLALYVALTRTRIWHPWRGRDISYGLYIWAWPLSQLLIAALGGLRWWSLALITSPLALLLGWLSWTLVEQPALAFQGSQLPSSASEPTARVLPRRPAA